MSASWEGRGAPGDAKRLPKWEKDVGGSVGGAVAVQTETNRADPAERDANPGAVRRPVRLRRRRDRRCAIAASKGYEHADRPERHSLAVGATNVNRPPNGDQRSRTPMSR